MHPPPFLMSHRLSDWPDCKLELHCCKGVSLYPVKLLIQKRGDPEFSTVIDRLKCAACGRKPAPVYLCAGHREHSGGSTADWAIELVPAARG
jgi:hypothetical protein